MNSKAEKLERHKIGSVHGRFQLPHLGHQEYIQAAIERCEFLWIGIARPDIQENLPCDIAKHREERESNPLTYFERLCIIREMLLDLGIGQNQFNFVPFPIDQPERLRDFLDISVVCFTTIYDDWNRHKINVLKEVGYEVEVLWERNHKQYTGQIIRDSISIGTSDWEQMVPAATVNAVRNLNLRQRLIDLRSL